MEPATTENQSQGVDCCWHWSKCHSTNERAYKLDCLRTGPPRPHLGRCIPTDFCALNFIRTRWSPV